MDTKNNIRQSLLLKRKQIPQEKKVQASEIICEFFKNSPAIQKAEILYLYIAKDPELSLMPLLRWALEQKKCVGVPKVHGDTMDFYQLTELEQLSPGAFGILEPNDDCPLLQAKECICLVPGVGFDKSGNRMGYGKGYYDKYFSQYPDLIRIGISYEEQVVEHIPADAYDKKMHMVVTPNRQYKISEAKI